jgi:hypothetical protein
MTMIGLTYPYYRGPVFNLLPNNISSLGDNHGLVYALMWGKYTRTAWYISCFGIASETIWSSRGKDDKIMHCAKRTLAHTCSTIIAPTLALYTLSKMFKKIGFSDKTMMILSLLACIPMPLFLNKTSHVVDLMCNEIQNKIKKHTSGKYLSHDNIQLLTMCILNYLAYRAAWRIIYFYQKNII